MKKNILVIDDSAFMRRVISDIINEDNEFNVKYMASNGSIALETVENYQDIDGIFLDLCMPVMDGLTFLKECRKRNINIPVILVSSSVSRDGAETMQALENGAWDFLKKPERLSKMREDDFKLQVTKRLDLLRVNPDKPGKQKNPNNVLGGRQKSKYKQDRREHQEIYLKPVQRDSGRGKNKLVALACSTGGPKALQMVIPYLPSNLNAPMVVVQHMPAGFTKSLSVRLNELSKIAVKEAEDNEVLEKGQVYIAQGGKHLSVANENGIHRIKLLNTPPRDALRPCANVMYESLVQSHFDEIVCVVLTGMGSDGTVGIQTLSKSQKLHVISQDQESCVVYGMPRAIYETGLVNQVLPLNKIANAITEQVGVS
ncbi:MAG: chemotaxis-specific protein-glutamate methyltransferase CheB [Lachnospiraceae bacterium]|nr:chemotaxis-specific protein-glutamate methyltransferase CheB [Lachnospiraceae bacterium]